MKVLVISHAYPPEGVGGTERYAAALTRALLERGHEVSVLTGSLEWREELCVEESRWHGAKVVRVHRSDLYFDHWDKVSNPHVAEVLERLLREELPDVVHLHQWIRLSSDLIRRSAARGVPAVLHLHDLFVTCPRVFRVRADGVRCEEPWDTAPCLGCVPRFQFQGDREIEASLRRYHEDARAELLSAAHRIAPSASHARSIRSYLRAEELPIEVLAHPLLPDACPGRGVDAASPAGRLKVLFFSHLDPVKGAHVLLQAVRSLGADSGVEVDLFGAAPRPEYERRLRELAEGLSVRFHGEYRIDEVASTAADAIAIPALARESYSFLLDEALALGAPILASRLGALLERGGERTLWFEPGDPGELAAHLKLLRDDPERRRSLRAAGVATPMTLEAHVERIESVYREVAARGAPRLGAPPPRPVDLMPEWDRRELAFQELLRSEGWRDVLARKEEELSELRKRLEDSSD